MSSEKTSNPEKYWLNIPEILGLEIYKGKNLKNMAKNRGKTFEKFWCWASLEHTVRRDGKCCKVAKWCIFQLGRSEGNGNLMETRP